MSGVGKAIDRCVQVSLAPLLKQEGFRRSGRTFLRDRDRCVHVVNVQANRWNAGQKGSFAVNLGIYFPEVVKAIGWTEVHPSPSPGSCTISRRLATAADETDHWWEVGPGSNLEEPGRAIHAAWLQIGKPWLERYSDLTEAARFRGAAPLVRAGILFLLDRPEEAGTVLREELGFVDASNPIYHSPLFAWARSRGIRNGPTPDPGKR